VFHCFRRDFVATVKDGRIGLQDWLGTVSPGEAFEVLIELIPDSVVFVVDGNHNIVHWNEEATKILGFEAEDVLGNHCLKANRCTNCMSGCGIERLGEVSNVPLTLVREDGVPVHMRKFARAFFDGEGNFAGGVEVLVADLTTEKRPQPMQPRGLEDFYGLLTRDAGMKRALQVVRNVAPTDTPVLIRGESGTGKELVAKGLHLCSSRAEAPFLAVNCAAFTPTLLESELFGHKQGAFTGAVRDKPGIFTLADGGTLFLDEVAELPLELQAKLLRVVQEQTFTPVGGIEARRVNVRIISATHRALREEVRAGRFREDLMFRLRVVPIYLPPLRERRQDIEFLLSHFTEERNQRGGRRLVGYSPEAMRALLDHSWPGNVRELQNVVDYTTAVARGTQVNLEDLPPEFREVSSRISSPSRLAPILAPRRRMTLEEERQAILDALEAAGGHVGRAAESLGMSRPTFWRRRKKHQI
jgi:PAS domain S-box-containing protein